MKPCPAWLTSVIGLLASYILMESSTARSWGPQRLLMLWRNGWE